MESRAYPIFKFNPDLGIKVHEALDLSGNPEMEKIWPSYSLKYLENGRQKKMELPMTFADFAITEARFRKHFRQVPRDSWNENMVLLADFLALEENDREGKFPFIWAINRQEQLNRVLVDKTIVESCEERRDFWLLLKSLAQVDKVKVADTKEVEQKIRAEVVGKIAQGLMHIASGEESFLPLGEIFSTTTALAPNSPNAITGSMGPWLDTADCSSCNECIQLNPSIFAYNADNKAYIKDADGGPYEDIVKAAEKCTARVIHPGLPKDTSIKDYDKWVKRGEKFNQ